MAQVVGALSYGAVAAAVVRILERCAEHAALEKLQAAPKAAGKPVSGRYVPPRKVGEFGTDHGLHAAVALIGLGANPPRRCDRSKANPFETDHMACFARIGVGVWKTIDASKLWPEMKAPPWERGQRPRGPLCRLPSPTLWRREYRPG